MKFIYARQIVQQTLQVIDAVDSRQVANVVNFYAVKVFKIGKHIHHERYNRKFIRVEEVAFQL